VKEQLSGSGIQPDVYYPSLTSLRGIAALWVIMLHSALVVDTLLPGRPQQIWNFFARPGFLGVNVFFVLSGFVLSLGYATWFEQGRPHPVRKWLLFVRNRAARIFPTHLVILIALAVAVWVVHVDLETAGAKHRWTAGAFVMSLLLVQTWFDRTDVWNAVAWSVSAEWLFYLLFPIVVNLTTRISKRLGSRGSGALGFFALAALAISSTLHHRGLTSWSAPIVVSAAIEFSSGALFWQREGNRMKHPLAEARRSKFRGLNATLLLALVVVGSALFASRGWPPRAWIVVIPWVVLAFASERSPRWLQDGWLRHLGEISYSLYLLHYPWQWFLRAIIPPTEFSGRHLMLRIGVLLVYVIPPFPAAWLSYRLIEKPGQRVFSDFRFKR
jgi:peptidoglycan/LPS O-acetylase OafA/YrhL